MNAERIYCSEIWPGFPLNASFNLEALDPIETEYRSNHKPVEGNSRKRRKEDVCTKFGASTSNRDGNDHDFQKEGEIVRCKAEGSSENLQKKVAEQGNAVKASEKSPKQVEQPKPDYIHVRARRGQATDSHSLAERARREKISERMKILQDLVPGCNKVIGKALVLDEIINYVQSLQHQVEFLSMKLEAVNTRVGIEEYPSKLFTFDSQIGRDYGRSSSPEWLHIGGGFERTS